MSDQHVSPLIDMASNGNNRFDNWGGYRGRSRNRSRNRYYQGGRSLSGGARNGSAPPKQQPRSETPSKKGKKKKVKTPQKIVLPLGSVIDVSDEGVPRVDQKYAKDGVVQFSQFSTKVCIVGCQGRLTIKFDLPTSTAGYNAVANDRQGKVFDTLGEFEEYLSSLVSLPELFQIQGDRLPMCPRRTEMKLKGASGLVTGLAAERAGSDQPGERRDKKSL